MNEITPEEKANMFSSGEAQLQEIMCCPYCGGNYLHGYGHVTAMTDGRSSYGVKFWCEFCPKRFVLWFVNHKGNTLIELERLLDEERQWEEWCKREERDMRRQYHRRSEGFTEG